MSQKLKKGMKAILITLMGLLMIVSAIAQTDQTIHVRGTVKDINGEAIIGANILLQGTSIGTITDFDGNFSLVAPPNGVLEIRYVGYKTQIVPINNRTHIQVILEEDVNCWKKWLLLGTEQ